MGELEEFIGFTIKRDLTNMNLKISQPDLIKNMIQVFDKDVKSLMTFNTPATPHKGIICNQETDTKISHDLQNRYRSGLGLLLYLVNHSRPELSNAVRELSKCMNETNMSHYKALLSEIKYVIDTKYYCYQMKQDGNIRIGGLVLCIPKYHHIHDSLELSDRGSGTFFGKIQKPT